MTPHEPRPRPRALRALEVILGGPTVGALWMVAVTAWVTSAGDDRYMGVRAAPVVELARTRFADDVRGLTLALGATAVGLGAALGVVAELLVSARRTYRGGLSTFGARLAARGALVLALHAAYFTWAAARMPQLYADVVWGGDGLGGALARTVAVIVTQLLGPAGVAAVALALAAAWAAPVPAALADAARKGRAWVRMPGRAVPLLIGAGSVVLVASAFGLVSGPRKSKRKGGAPNIVILAADSLRDDRLDPRIAPRLSSIGAKGARFSRAYVTVPRTLPSWTTILTGMEPHKHGLRTMFPRYEDRARDLSALPARLAKLGYRTGVVGDYAADIFTRVRYGFDLVDAPTFNFHALIATRALERATPLLPFLHSRTGRGIFPAMRELNQAADPHLVSADARRAIDRLGGGDSPFLLTVFFSTAHFPYAAPAPYYGRFTDPAYRGRFKFHKPNVLGDEAPLDVADIRQVRALYDGAVASIDDAAGEILDDLRARGLDEDTIIVVTSDHGENIFEHGRGQGHGDHLFGDEVVHMPLAMRIPERILAGASGRRIDDVVRDIDLAPTLLDLLGVPASVREGLDGRSLRPLLSGRTMPKAPAFTETEIWMTENIPEVPSSGPSPLRIPYPNVALLTELDPRLSYDVVLRREVTPLILAAKHRSVIDQSLKLVYVPTRKGARFFLFDRERDPDEVHDLSRLRPDDTARLRATLFRWMLSDPAMEERDGMLIPRAMRDEVVAGAPSTGLRVQ